MRYVIIRDDDANATTSPDLLETLYRPFLEQGMPVHLATIPEVHTSIIGPDGHREGFLNPHSETIAPIGSASSLCEYIQSESKYAVLQHGLRHEFVEGRYEFGRNAPEDLTRRIQRGLSRLKEAGFSRPIGFVAPQDQISSQAILALTKEFQVISSGAYWLKKLPRKWQASYILQKKIRKQRHYRLGDTVFLTHPGCTLSHRAPVEGMADRVIDALKPGLNVVVSHHWEYKDGHEKTNRPFVDVLHELAEHFGKADDIRIVGIDHALTSTLH